jgi:hypothetical protein
MGTKKDDNTLLVIILWVSALIMILRAVIETIW